MGGRREVSIISHRPVTSSDLKQERSFFRGSVSTFLQLVVANQNRFPLDFLFTFTIILPSVTQTVDNSNLPVTRSNFCFPSDHLLAFIPHPIFLFPVICFENPLTRTFFNFLRRFELSGVDCTCILVLLKICTYQNI